MSSLNNLRIVSSTISLGALSVISMAIGLATTIAITHSSSSDAFGAYTLILVVVSFLTQVCSLGLELSVSRFVAGAEDEASKERVVGTAVIMRAGAIALGSLVCWLGWGLLVMLYGESLLPDMLYWVALLFAIESLRALFQSVLQGCFLFQRMGLSDLIASVMNFVLVCALAWAGSVGITSLVVARAVSCLLGGACAFVWMPVKKVPHFSRDAFIELGGFGLPLQANDILSFISMRVDTLVIAALLGPSDIAFYEVARRIPDSVRRLYEPFRSVYYPFMTKCYALGDRTQVARLLNDATRFVAFAMLFGTCIVLLFGQEIITILFSDQYLSSVPVFLILMVNLSIALVGNVMGTTLVAVGESKKPVVINILNATATLAGSMVFIPALRIVGAGIATTVGTALSYPATAFFLSMKTDLRNSAFLRPCALFCVWSLSVFLLRPESLLIRVALLGVFLLASVALSIVSLEDLAFLAEGAGLDSRGTFRRLASFGRKG